MTATEFFTWQLVAASGALLAIIVAAFLAFVVCAIREQWRQGDEPIGGQQLVDESDLLSIPDEDTQRYDPMRWNTRQALTPRSHSEFGAYL